MWKRAIELHIPRSDQFGPAFFPFVSVRFRGSFALDLERARQSEIVLGDVRQDQVGRDRSDPIEPALRHVEAVEEPLFVRSRESLRKKGFFYSLNAPVQRRGVSPVRCNRLLAG
jgi:hypothetical protein